MEPIRRVGDIGQDNLIRMVNHFISHPDALDARGNEKSPPQPISINTTAMSATAAKYYFVGLWNNHFIE